MDYEIHFRHLDNSWKKALDACLSAASEAVEPSADCSSLAASVADVLASLSTELVAELSLRLRAVLADVEEEHLFRKQLAASEGSLEQRVAAMRTEIDKETELRSSREALLARLEVVKQIPETLSTGADIAELERVRASLIQERDDLRRRSDAVSRKLSVLVGIMNE